MFKLSLLEAKLNMGSPGSQVKNGKAFEYAVLTQYVAYLKSIGVKVNIIEDNAYKTARSFYEGQPDFKKKKYDESAKATIETIVKLEPGLVAAKSNDDILQVSIAVDSEGQDGDVRDVVFERPSSKWEVGFSAKNNHDAVKHSRLSNQIDFGASWLGIPCSSQYWEDIKPIFDKVLEYKSQGLNWDDIPNKAGEIYLPLLMAFKKEVLFLYSKHPSIPSKLIKYLIGKYPFYKIIKEDKYNLVVVKAFNIEGKLNKKVNGVSPRYKTPRLNLPSRIVEFNLKKDSETTLIMILDEGWEISFRIHNAETKIVPSLKFDIQLLGNPPILFTQHLFQ